MRSTRLERDAEARLRAAGLTYDQVGATSGVLPGGYHHLNRRVTLGMGAARFDAAAGALVGWQMHLRSGFEVSASSGLVVPDAVVILGVHAGPLRLSAPCRVVYVLDEPRRRGFAYGTLTGHPESGEEAFVIERADDDTVSFSVTAFSRPASDLARLAGPLGRLAQRRMSDRYVRSMADATGVR
ncbi:MAG TPA: DUF1990 domain-containing protein [Dermatophilaceae bacterium]